MNLKSHVKLVAVQFQAALLVLFLALRLTGHIGWHYALVISPAWVPIGAVLAYAVLCGTIDTYRNRWPRRAKRYVPLHAKTFRSRRARRA